MLRRSLLQCASLRRSAPAARPFIADRPMMEVHSVSETPEEGSLTRLVAQSRGIRLTVLPQLGGPKSDPIDNRPQFDSVRRAATFLAPKDVAAMVLVLEGKVPEYKMSGEFRTLSFAPIKSDDGSKAFAITGDFMRANNTSKQLINSVYQGGNITGLHHFLESSLIQGFGFRQFHNPPARFHQKIQRFVETRRNRAFDRRREDRKDAKQ
jgi:hypothetical protein